MYNGHNGLRQFGNCRLDVGNKLLWFGDEPVHIPPKAVEVLCLLVERHGAVVSKDEIWNEVWPDAFVEETNLTHNIYLLRKTLKDLGEQNLIQTVPRRGYRFAGDITEVIPGDVILERHTSTKTLIEIRDGENEEETSIEKTRSERAAPRFSSQLAISAVVVGAILLAGVFLLRNYNRQTRPLISGVNSIAVLPVKSFPGGADNEELRLRITDALITKLGHLDRIAVRPTSAVMPFGKADSDAVNVGRQLRVDAVIDSRIQQEGDRIRVTVQMVNVARNQQIWSEQFDGQADQVLDLQDVIATKVAASLVADPHQQQAVAKRPTDNPEAYEAYLKGRYYWGKRDEVSLRRAIEYFKAATALDPRFSEAYAGLADTQHLLFNYNIEVSPQIIAEAKENLRRALELKPDSAEALTTLGTIQMGYDWDWQAAEQSLRKAIDAAPNSPTARMRYGALLVRLARFAESEAEFGMGIELDPLSTVGTTNLGLVYFCKGDFAAADAQYRKTLQLDGSNGPAHWLLSRSLWQEGKRDEAVNEIVTALNLDGNALLAEKIAAKSRKAPPQEAVRLLLYEWRDNPPGTNPHNLAYLSTYLNDRERAMYWIERSLDEHHPWTTWVFAAPEFASLRDLPRFQQILRNLNFVK